MSLARLVGKDVVVDTDFDNTPFLGEGGRFKLVDLDMPMLCFSRTWGPSTIQVWLNCSVIKSITERK